MYTVRQIRQGLRRAVTRILPALGGRKSSPAFYPQEATCQIPTLNHLFSLFLGEREGGTFVEVGAYDGVFVSNTWGLAERNWNGYMVEPVPELAAKARHNHRAHPLVSVTETAIGAPGTTELRLYLAGTLTTASESQKKEYESVDWASASVTTKEIVVPSQPLDSFLEMTGLGQDFDVLVVDVEGFEAQVFEGFTVARWRPKMIIVELADTHPDLGTTKTRDAELGRDLISAGYSIVYKDSINTVLVRRDVWEHAFGL